MSVGCKESHFIWVVEKLGCLLSHRRRNSNFHGLTLSFLCDHKHANETKKCILNGDNFTYSF